MCASAFVTIDFINYFFLRLLILNFIYCLLLQIITNFYIKITPKIKNYFKIKLFQNAK